MVVAFATVKDIGDRLGRPITDQTEVSQVNAWISDVETIIRTRVTDIDERLNTGVLNPTVLCFVTANAVIRKVKNPDGKQNERIDDYSYGLTEDAARGDLFLTDAEWGLLIGSTGEGAFTIGNPFEQARWQWVTSTDRVPLP